MCGRKVAFHDLYCLAVPELLRITLVYASCLPVGVHHCSHCTQVPLDGLRIEERTEDGVVVVSVALRLRGVNGNLLMRRASLGEPQPVAAPVWEVTWVLMQEVT